MATGASKWGGACATVAYNATAAGASGVLERLAARYGGAAANKAAVEHSLLLYGR